MSGLGRKRSSKWDMSDQPLYDEVHPQDDGYSSKSGRPIYERESGGWRSPDLPGSKWPTQEANDSRSKRDTILPSREHFHGIRNSHKNGEDPMVWEKDRDYGARMSPGIEWRQQNPSQFPRDRSRSRSRSRGRSRSPNHSLRRESGPVDRSRNRSGTSNQVCIDFNSGRCRRGDHCHFLHDDSENYDDYRDNRHRKGGSANYANIDVREYASRSGRSSSSAPCNDFLKGRCRRGASCRFDHHISSDDFSKADEENDRSRRDASPERAAEHEFRRNSNIPCKFYAAGNCRNGKTCRFSHITQAYSSPDDRRSQEKSTLGRKSDDTDQTWDGPKWNDKAILSNDPKISSEIDVQSGLDLSSSGWSMNDRLRKSMHNESAAIINPKSNENEVLQRRAENSGSRHGEKWLEDMDMSPDWNYAVKSDSHNDVSLKPSKHGVSESVLSRFNENDAILKPITLPYDDMSGVRKAIISPQSFDQNGQNQIALPFSRSSKVEQSQTALPTNQVSSVDGKSFLKPEYQDKKPSQVGSDIPPSPNSVSGEQLKNLSASLVHLLGNGQQLYAALSSNNSLPKAPFTNPEGSVLPVSGSIIHSETHKRYDPVLDSTDTRPEISHNVPEVKSDTQLKNLDPDGTEGVDQKSKSLNSQDPKAKSEASKAKKEKKTEENKKAEESENLDKEKSSNGKKNKDVKGARAFKFALVEFVKELLKPSWKEGQVGKDAYKTIVKKVVDKVTATMQGASVPQTQEKIDHYLSFSKEKLTKLVQAYVEKTPKV